MSDWEKGKCSASHYIFLLSFKNIAIDKTAAEISAIGPEYMMPSIPINRGKIKIKGRRNIICLVSDKKMPLFGFPIAVKKLEVKGCIQFKKVPSKNIRK